MRGLGSAVLSLSPCTGDARPVHCLFAMYKGKDNGRFPGRQRNPGTGVAAHQSPTPPRCKIQAAKPNGVQTLVGEALVAV